MGDYIYHNASDTVRVRIFKRDHGAWDFDVFKRGGWNRPREVWTYSCEAGDYPRSKRDAKQIVEREFGALTSIQPCTVTEGWEIR